MLILRYLDEENEYEISFEYVNDNVCGILGDIPLKTNGFLLKEPLEFKTWENDSFDYSKYTTVYHQEEGAIYFSNDGSVYTEPEDEGDITGEGDTEDESETPEVIPYEPTIEEVRLNKCMTIKMQTAGYIYAGLFRDDKHIFYEETEFKNKLEQSVQTDLPVVFQGVSYNPEEMKELYVLLEDNKSHYSIYGEILESYIKTLEDEEEIHELTYGVELEGEFLEEYNSKLREAKEITQKYIDQLGYANTQDLIDTQLGLAEAYEQGVVVEEELLNTQLGLAESYEQNLITEEQLTDLQLAVCDIYELILGGTE